MGFDLSFLGMDGGSKPADPDREALRRFVSDRGLAVAHNGRIVDGTGKPIKFDGRVSGFSLDNLESPEPVEGSLSHASLSPEECQFVYELCAASGFVIVNPQGPPMVLVSARSHTIETASIEGWPSDPSDVVWVDSPEQLSQALSGDFERFQQYRQVVLGTGSVDPST